MRMGYIDYVPNRDTLLFRDGKGRAGWNAHTGTWLPGAWRF
jgi:hypothetical protein